MLAAPGFCPFDQRRFDGHDAVEAGEEIADGDAGASGALTPVKRGPKAGEANPLAAEVALLQRNNADLTRRLARAETIIDVQKKVAALLGLTPDGGGL